MLSFHIHGCFILNESIKNGYLLSLVLIKINDDQEINVSTGIILKLSIVVSISSYK